jgi:hypothetical protein
MKKRITIILACLAIGAMLACLVLYGRNKPVQVSGGLTPQDVVLIRRDYARLQRQNVRKALASANPLFLLTSLRELAFGRVLGVGSPLDGCAVVSTGYAWSTNTVWVCDLVRRTNVWCLP